MSEITVQPGGVYRFHWNAGEVDMAVETVTDGEASGYLAELLQSTSGNEFCYKRGWASVELDRIIAWEYWCPADPDHAVGVTEPFDLERADE